MNVNNIFLKWKASAPYLLSVLRIAAALLFIQAGTMKLFAFPVGMPPDGGTADLFSQIGLAGILETFGGALILLGLFTRPVAFILACEMVIAYLQGHLPNGPWPIINGGINALLYCFIFLYISSAGPGPWSIDKAEKKNKAVS